MGNKEKHYIAIKGHKCAICGSTENIDVHHLTYERIFNEDIEDLEPVCRERHKKIHSDELLFWGSIDDLLHFSFFCKKILCKGFCVEIVCAQGGRCEKSF